MQQPDDMRGATEPASRWTFLTNHAHVLLTIAADPGIRARDIAQRVGITERAAQRIVAELESAGYLTRWREGRRNHYEVHSEVRLRHPVEQHHAVGQLLQLLAPEGADHR
jgi:DNA-binding IclR family transcriptional regulator